MDNAPTNEGKTELYTGMVISAYTVEAFKEYQLPALKDANYSITLRSDFFCLKNNLILDLENLGGQWRFRKSSHYTLHFEKNRPYSKENLKNGMLIYVKAKDEAEIALIVKSVGSLFHAYEKISLSEVDELTIGRNAHNDISYNYEIKIGADKRKLVSKHHAKVKRSKKGYQIIDCSGSDHGNGVYVNFHRVEKEQELEFGDFIDIMGLRMVFLTDCLAVDQKGSKADYDKEKWKKWVPLKEDFAKSDPKGAASSGRDIYHRAPRILKEAVKGTVEIEAPPQMIAENLQPLWMAVGPSFTMALPTLIGCIALTLSMGGGQFLYSGLMVSGTSAFFSIFWMLMNRCYQKKEKEEREKRRVEQYRAYLSEKEEEVWDAYKAISADLLEMYPSASECLDFDRKGGVLWNRNATHKDFLKYRLGIGTVPFPVEIHAPKKRLTAFKDDLEKECRSIQEKFSKLRNVPVALDLFSHHLIGVIGGKGREGAIAVGQLIAAQIAATNCYTDVKMAFFYNDGTANEEERWKFAKWFPHVWSEDKRVRYMASNSAQANDVCYELAKIFRKRAEEKKDADVQAQIPKPYYVVFVSDPSMLEGTLAIKYLYEMGGAVGLTAFILTERYEDLPNACDFIIENTPEYQGMYSIIEGEGNRQEITFDSLGEAALKDFSRRLTGLRVHEIETGAEMPGVLTFFEMYQITRPEELPVKELWAKNRTYDNIRGVIGVKAGGVPCYLDLHEKYHGPHGIVAGMTGSGKSEMMQAFILSLAVNYSPEDVVFYIIDYKGGSMSNLFDKPTRLPHLVGQISNLSGNQVKRVMLSIKSENRRRQREFAKYNVNSIDLYTQKYRNGEAEISIPHLFIIVDEFSVLKREQKDFLQELISVAQLGRSLGVHLILTTQRPTGNVDDDIRCNSKFSLCFRVQDTGDSIDILHKPDAAYITQAGRGYLRVGNDEVYELFQSGYSGAVYEEQTDGSNVEIVKLLNLNGKVEMTGKSVKESQKGKSSRKEEKTQFDVVKEELARIAEESNCQANMKLVLPMLPEQIYLDDMDEFKKSCYQEGAWPECGEEEGLELIVGTVDDPENQSQMPLSVDVVKSGHIGIYGDIVSGKSTMMQTMAYAAIHKYSPKTVSIYVLDFGGAMMSAFVNAPHVGGVMLEHDLDKIKKFFHMMMDELEDRKRQDEVRDGETQPQKSDRPMILIFIDDYASFMEKTDEQYEGDVIALLKEGIGHDIFLIVSGGGVGTGDIPSRIRVNIAKALCLQLKDSYIYKECLSVNQLNVLPEGGIKGRGLAELDDRILEYQAALCLKEKNEYQRLKKIQKRCMEMSAAWQGNKARQIV